MKHWNLKEMREVQDEWVKVQERVVQQIRERWNQKQYTTEEIEEVEGILYINALEHRPFGM